MHKILQMKSEFNKKKGVRKKNITAFGPSWA